MTPATRNTDWPANDGRHPPSASECAHDRRLALIPVFVALMLTADGGHSWPAGIVFGVAGVTDQIDGFLARRWHVESDFGRIFDPLADRLMIDAAVILLFVQDHMPWPAWS